MLKKLNISEIREVMANIKKKRRKVITNYYNQCDGYNEKLETILLKDTIAFLYLDVCVKRVYFYTNNEEELITALKELPKDCLCDYLTKKENDKLDLFEKSGFEKYAVYGRFVSNEKDQQTKEIIEKRSKYIENSGLYNEAYGRVATQDDAKNLYKRLIEIFDSKIDHFCSLEELRRLIDKKWVWVHVEDGKVIAANVYKIEGYKKYGYYMYNDGEPGILHTILRKSNKTIHDAGVTYFYCWMDYANKRAIKYNTLTGMKFDGLLDYIYIK